ncbi:MAG: sensor histidine kinase [Thermodesulfobacteriota bacterium]
MSLGIITTADKAQGLRIRRSFMAVVFFVLCYGLVWLALQAGFVDLSPEHFAAAFAVNMTMMAIPYAVIRTGLNLKFRDPSLTIPQMVIAIFWTTYLMLHVQEIRGAFLAIYFLTILFGVFQLNRGEFILVSLIAITGYGLVIIWDMSVRPPRFDLTLNVVQFIILSVCLFWLSFIGSYIKGIRERLKASKITLEQRHVEIVNQRDSLRRAHAQLEETNRALEASIRELRQTQDQLVQSEKMAALGGLVAGVAHEINTPLSVAIMAASLLEDKSRDQEAHFRQGVLKRSDLEKYLKTAIESCRLLSNNLNKVADLVRHFKQVAVEPTGEEKRRIHIKSFIDEILIGLGAQIHCAGHTVEVDCPEDIELVCYPGLFYQIFTTLIYNSLLHGFEGMTAGRISILARREESWLVLYYTDNGKGMDQATLGKVFDPFFTTKRARGGTGLGMHILYNLVTQMLKGRVECTSTPGEGVLFLLRIPMPPE